VKRERREMEKKTHIVMMGEVSQSGEGGGDAERDKIAKSVIGDSEGTE